MSYSGYDIEDAVILNRSSLDRGFGRALYIRRYGTSLRKYPNGATDIIAKVQIPQEKQSKLSQAINKKFHALDEDGMVRIGEQLNNGDVYLNKHVPQCSVIN